MSSKRPRTSYEADSTGTHRKPPFVLYGSPLPPLDNDARDDGTYVPLWKQEVRDEKGRKRLHGAFTGGFSAGYFNTVGSKEGWTPSTFVSSRSQRRKDGSTTTSQRPEDFMDDEDIADLQDSQKLQTQSGFSVIGSDATDGHGSGFFADLFRPSSDTVGVKLLQRMGWRPGQGLGPKVKRAAKGDEVLGDEGKEHLFAPDDVPMVLFDRKTDKYGIGWKGEQHLGSKTSSKVKTFATENGDESADESEEALFRTSKSVKKPNSVKKTGFGVGILNDTGSDDDDPYEMGPKISYNRVIGGDRKKRKGGIIANSSAPTVVSKPVFLSQKLLGKQIKKSNFRRCHDGRLPLDGFVLAAQALTLDDGNKYSPPTVPEGWKPSRLQNPSQNSKPDYQSLADTAKSSTLDPSQRANILGETLLPGKSIFDFISPSARDRLASASGAALPQGKGERGPAGYEPSLAIQQKTMWDLVPRLDKVTAQAALTRGANGWMPYAEDLDKRERYRLFLQTTIGEKQDLPPRASGASTDEWATEMREFAQAAQVFRPVTGLMASRFTSARDSPAKASDAPELSSEKDKAEKDNKDDPAENAARLGMYGLLTRSVADFYPTRLVCKRFGVKAPAHVLHGPDAGEGNEAADKRDILGGQVMEAMKAQAAAAAPTTPGGQDLSREIPQQSAVVDTEHNDALEGKRAGEDLFRAVFGSDSEDD